MGNGKDLKRKASKGTSGLTSYYLSYNFKLKKRAEPTSLSFWDIFVVFGLSECTLKFHYGGGIS